ncbi:MAG TPA: alpha/beta hydrolase [Dehalococcoidia bacterium]|nr:alpha/beta hydrolase [Dehalococcoidia bacterium]
MHAFRIPGSNASLCYHDIPGEEPALVFLHGLGGASSEGFLVIARHPLLAASRIVLVDLLGFGYSDRPEAFGYSMEEHADSVAALLEHLGLFGCRVIGHSMGGSIAILLAFRFPSLVSALVVAEGNLDPGKGGISLQIAAQPEEVFIREGHATLMHDLKGWLDATPAYGGAFRAVQGASPQAIYRSAQSLLAARQPTLRQALEQLAIPRTYLIGERSLPGFPEGPAPANGVEVAYVADAGHLMNADNPDGFACAIAHAFGMG